MIVVVLSISTFVTVFKYVWPSYIKTGARWGKELMRGNYLFSLFCLFPNPALCKCTVSTVQQLLRVRQGKFVTVK